MGRKAVVGYLPNWTASASYINAMPIEDMTHLIYFSVSVDADGNLTPPNSNWPPSRQLLDKVSDAKVDFQITVGPGKDVQGFLTAGETAWENASDQLNQIIMDHGFTGASLDFEGMDTSDEKTMDGFRDSIRYLIKHLPDNASSSSIAVQGGGYKKMDLDQLKGDVDMFFLMAYDFHWSSAPNTGAVAPLPPENVMATYNVGSLLQGVIDLVGAEKVVLGVPWYGYSWPCDNDQAGCKTTGRGSAWVIQKVVNNPPGEILWDDSVQSPWVAYLDEGEPRQLWFDDHRSLRIKYEYALAKGCQGIGFWALGYERSLIGTPNDPWLTVRSLFPGAEPVPLIQGGLAGLRVADLNRALDFYVDTLGLKLAQKENDEAIIDAGGFRVCLHLSSSRVTPSQGEIGLYTPGDLERAVNLLKGRGVVFSGEIREEKGRRFAHFFDPDGNAVYLYH